MAHWAEIDGDGIVLWVTVGNSDDPGEGYDWLLENLGGAWVQTSYETLGGVHYTDGEPSEDQTQAFRFNYAGIGFTYDADRDAFIPPTPHLSWVLDEATCLWEAPIDYPADGKMYTWDEPTTDWREVDNGT